MYCQGIQRGPDPIAKGNGYADDIAWWAAIQGSLYQSEVLALIVQVSLKDFAPHYSSKETLATEVLHARKHLGWWVLPDSRPFVPDPCTWELVQQTHEATHLGKGPLAKLILSNVYVERIYQLTAVASSKCLLCTQNNARQGLVGPLGTQRVGDSPFQCIMTDFTEMPKCRGYKYLLVFIDTFSNWPEAIPCRTEQAK